MWLYFFYLYFLSSVITISFYVYFFLQFDTWSIKNWLNIELTEREFEQAKKTGTIILLTPLSIIMFGILIYIMAKEILKVKS